MATDVPESAFPVGVPSWDSDDEAMDRLRRGDDTALQLLLDRHWPAVARFAHSLCGDRDQAEDLAQEAFFALWRKRQEWDSRGHVRAFLFRVIRSGLVEEVRHLEVRSRTEDGVRDAFRRPSRTPLDEFLDRRLLAVLQEGIHSLPSRRREVLSLARFHGLSYQEIAELLGLSVQTVANHLSMALRELRALVAEERQRSARLVEVTEPGVDRAG